MRQGPQRARVAIAGVGETRVGKVPDRSSLQLHAEATLLALADAGLEPGDVDLLITANSRVKPYLYHADVVAEYLGIHPAHCLTINTGGSASVALLQYADAMITVGNARVAVIVKADNLATGMGRDATIESMAAIGHPEFESPSGPLIPALYAMIASRYQHERGVKPEDIAAVAVVDREHAARHPGAQFVTPLTVDDVLGSKLIADPLHLLECAPISDGGAAVVVAAADQARDLPHPPVYLRGIAEHHDFEHLTQAADLGTTGAAVTGPQALQRSGLSHGDIDVAMVYDAFTFIQCIQLEDLGFCGKGEGGSFVTSGHTRLDGSLPTNTHGGVLSHSHAGKPSAVFLLTEAVHQLRGSAVGRQVRGAANALVHAEGGILASHCTAVLSRDPG
jgi:acetyl-CoA acetyltransferase